MDLEENTIGIQPCIITSNALLVFENMNRLLSLLANVRDSRFALKYQFTARNIC